MYTQSHQDDLFICLYCHGFLNAHNFKLNFFVIYYHTIGVGQCGTNSFRRIILREYICTPMLVIKKP